jgi:hypothetical protein
VSRRTPLVAAVLLGLANPSCGVQGLNFVQDDRVTIVAPRDRAEVRLPVTLRWSSRDFDGTYAVFVDRAPVPPGRTLAWIARDDELCRQTPGCPDAAWLGDRDVYATSSTELTIDDLPDLTEGERRDFHEASVILLDDEGRRVGEAAFTVEFQVAHDG